MGRLRWCYNVEDLRRAARRRLPKGIFDYVDLGTEEGVALRDNRSAFDRVRLTTRFMVDLTERDFGTEVFGERCSMPLGIAPTGIAGLCGYRAELALARAARDAGIPFTLAQPSLTPMKAVAEVGGNLWFQIYLWEEMKECYEQVRQARDLGFGALVVTIDSGLGRVREHNERNGFDFPFRPNVRALTDMLRHPGWLTRVLLPYLLTGNGPRNAIYPPRFQRVVAWRTDVPKPRRHEGMTWGDLAELRDIWPGPLVVKSVLSAHDAREAVDHGADGVIVSNHGGRSMDSALPTIEVLPDIVAEIGDEATVILDSGVRRGSDVVKALALGADLAMIGRAPLYGAATGGQAGVARCIEILRSEFEKTMGYIGCRSIEELGPQIVAATRPAGNASSL